MSAYILTFIGLAIILFILWYRPASDAGRAKPDRSLPGEAATVFEDLAEDIIRPAAGHSDPGAERNGLR
ncbi:hypothetical protein BH11PSE6_BH11PSE6_07090 [soil metagenome]